MNIIIKWNNIKCEKLMNSKVKKYLGPILGLIGSLMFLITAISYIYGGGNIDSFGAILPMTFLMIFIFGLIGVIVGFIDRRSASSCLMLFASLIAILSTLTGIAMLLNFSILCFIICVFATILLIFGGALGWRSDEKLKKTTE